MPSRFWKKEKSQQTEPEIKKVCCDLCSFSESLGKSIVKEVKSFIIRPSIIESLNLEEELKKAEKETKEGKLDSASNIYALGAVSAFYKRSGLLLTYLERAVQLLENPLLPEASRYKLKNLLDDYEKISKNPEISHILISNYKKFIEEEAKSKP